MYTHSTELVRDAATSMFGYRITGFEFDRWLADVQAQAWQEGFNDARNSNLYVYNPYRKEQR